MTPSLIEELAAELAHATPAAANADLDAGDWITRLVKILGQVGEEALLLSQLGMRRRLLQLAAAAIGCIEDIDRRLAPRSTR